MSAYSTQIVSVVKELKIDILRRLDSGLEVGSDEVDSITRDAFKKCAKDFDVTESTIRDKATRRMAISTQEFYKLVKQYILHENDFLEEKVITYMPAKDSESEVRTALQNAR